jgi:hypothetical protein
MIGWLTKILRWKDLASSMCMYMQFPCHTESYYFPMGTTANQQTYHLFLILFAIKQF